MTGEGNQSVCHWMCGTSSAANFITAVNGASPGTLNLHISSALQPITYLPEIRVQHRHRQDTIKSADKAALGRMQSSTHDMPSTAPDVTDAAVAQSNMRPHAYEYGVSRFAYTRYGSFGSDVRMILNVTLFVCVSSEAMPHSSCASDTNTAVPKLKVH